MAQMQTYWPISLTTPLGTDVLVPDSYTASEGISQMFQVRLEAVAADGKVKFDKILGQRVDLSIKLPDGSPRVWNGIVSRITQGGRTTTASTTTVSFTLEVVPELWLLTRMARCRIFQQKSVSDILKTVVTGLDTQFQLQGTYKPRNYCVQYRETDFHFMSRLMEEEGIFYFFKHTAGSHTMVIADRPTAHLDMPGGNSLKFDEVQGGTRQQQQDRIRGWQRSQEIRSGKTTLRDHHFELPDQNLEAEETSQEDAKVGTQTLKLKLPVSASLEQYDYPGGYAKRFDGVGPGGSDTPEQVNEIFTDKTRTVDLRMEAETSPGLLCFAESNCRQVVSGYKFNLEDHFSDSDEFVVIAAEHSGSHPLGTERNGDAFQYSNRFTCVPLKVPYRPPRITAVPVVRGTQTAVVVGSQGEEIFTDKYGRVKVQFFWDRDGKKDPDSSCWLRVATPWAGKKWGIIHIPRVGMEVLVDFLEGDPDRPIIIGCVYNSDYMPPYALPANKTQSGIKSRSSKQGGTDNFNEFRFEDKKGSELIFLHAEKDLTTEVENDEIRDVHHDRTTTIKNDETKTVTDGNEKTTVSKGNQTIIVSQGNQATTISQGNQSLEISMGNQTVAIKMGNQSTKLDLGKSETEAMQSIELKVGQSSVLVDQMGVHIKGMMIDIQGQVQVQVKGLMIQVSADAMLMEKGGIVMIN